MTKQRMEENRLFKLRARISYSRWEEVYDNARNIMGLSHPKCRQVCLIAFNAVEAFHGHGSETQAYYSSESMLQVCEDKRKVDRKGA